MIVLVFMPRGSSALTPVLKGPYDSVYVEPEGDVRTSANGRSELVARYYDLNPRGWSFDDEADEPEFYGYRVRAYVPGEQIG